MKVGDFIIIKDAPPDSNCPMKLLGYRSHRIVTNVTISHIYTNGATETGIDTFSRIYENCFIVANFTYYKSKL